MTKRSSFILALAQNSDIERVMMGGELAKFAVDSCKRRYRFCLIALLPFLSLVFLCSTASAAVNGKDPNFPVPVVAIVDVQRILQESLAAKSVQQQLESHREKFQFEISVEEKELRQSEQDLTKSREKVQPDVYAEREQQLRQRFLLVERSVQSRRKSLDQAFTDSMNVVRKNLLEVVAAIASDHGANLVIVKQQALWSDKKMDITDEVLAKLNTILPTVQVKVASDEGEKASPTKH